MKNEYFQLKPILAGYNQFLPISTNLYRWLVFINFSRQKQPPCPGELGRAGADHLEPIIY